MAAASTDPAGAGPVPMPVPGDDYPRTWLEFQEFFPDEEACARYLERLSWDLKRRLGLASYETAWMLLHRYRRAMVRSGRPRLHGVVEIGHTTVGERAAVAIAVEDRGSEPGRVRMRQADAPGPREVADFAAWAVEPGTIVRTSDGRADAALVERGYLAPPGGAEGGAAHAQPALPFAELVARLLRRWLAGTHQGAPAPSQLDWYLDEFTFRFNRRWATHRGLLFYRLLEEAVVTPPLPYDAVAASRRAPGDLERPGQA